MNFIPSKPIFSLVVPAGYWVGMPMFVTATLANNSQGAIFHNIPPCDPLSSQYPIEFSFTREIERNNEKISLPFHAPFGSDEYGAFSLSPGQSRTYVIDLGEHNPKLAADQWQLSGEWIRIHARVPSESVNTEIHSAEPSDVKLVSALKRKTRAKETSWRAFLMYNPRTISKEELRELSETCRREIQPYLFLHRAIWGPQPPDSLPLELLNELESGPWGAEANLARYECLWARNPDEAVASRDALLSEWPGFQFRVDLIETGRGLISELRKMSRRDAMQFNSGEGPYDE